MSQLPSKLLRNALDWLCGYAPTPMMRIASGNPVQEAADRYNTIMLGDLDHWIDALHRLTDQTNKQLTMVLRDAGKRACFLYQPGHKDPATISMEEVLQPVSALTVNYRQAHALMLAKAVGLPKLLTDLLSRATEYHNALQVVIGEQDPEYQKLQQLVDAALIEQPVKQEKKLIKLGFLLHRLRTMNLTPSGHNGIVFEYTNSLRIQLYSNFYSWRGDLTIVIYCSDRGAVDRLKADLQKLKLPEPDPVINRHGQFSLFPI